MLKRRDLLLIAAYSWVLVWLAGLRPLWLDEVLQLIASTQPNIRGLIRWVTYNPGAAPAGYLVQRMFALPLGLAPLAARAAPAVFGVLAALALAGFARALKASPVTVALAVFLVAPLELRYAVEGRPYSQALFFGLAALWCLWRLAEAPSWKIAAAYAALVSAGLYTQLLSVSVQLGALAALTAAGQRKAKRLGGIALAIACALFAPWYLYVRSAWHFGITASHFSFAMAPKTLAMLVREISGGGYVASLALIGAAALGWRRADRLAHRFLLGGIASGIVGAIAADAFFGYFFAGRQILFVLPALVLLATVGFRNPRCERWQAALLAIFVIASLIKDVRYFRSPGEDWPGAARAVLAATNHGACAIVPSPEPKEMYKLFVPGLAGRFCDASDAARQAVIVQSRYTVASSLQEATRTLAARGFRPGGKTDICGVRLVQFFQK